jgi:hypothetical protein
MAHLIRGYPTTPSRMLYNDFVGQILHSMNHINTTPSKLLLMTSSKKRAYDCCAAKNRADSLAERQAEQVCYAAEPAYRLPSL